MSSASPEARLRVGDLTFDARRRSLRRGKEGIALSGRLFTLFRTLAEAAPEVVTHDDIATRVWGPRRVVTPENLAQHIAMLRRALGDDAAAPRYIEAVRGEGYRLVASVKPESEVIGPVRRLWLPASAAAVLVVTAFFAGLMLSPAGMESPSLGAGSGLAESMAEAVIPKSILVLPLVSQSTASDHELFADGLSEELINQLSGIDGLLVMGRTTSFALKGHSASAQEIGRLTRAAYILEGSVRRDGDRVRIAVQLARSDNGIQVWSFPFDRALGDILEIQQEIASSVAVAIDAKLTAPSLDDMFFGMPGPSNPDAYDLYLRAQALIRSGSTEEMLRAETLLRTAIDADPEFLAAKGILARTLGMLRFYVPERAEQLLAEWDEIMNSLEESMPSHPVVTVSRGLRSADQHNWISAERYVESVSGDIPAGPLRRELNDLLVSVQRITGRFTETLEYLRLSARADPLSLDASTVLQRSLYALGRLAEAEQEYGRSLGLPGDRSLVESVALLRAILEDFDADEIARRLERYVAAAPDRAELVGALVNRLNDPVSALAILRDAMSGTGPRALHPLEASCWADFLGDMELALDSLRVYFEQTRRIQSAVWSPCLAKSRQTESFKAIARDFGLADYWRETGHWGDFCRPVGDSDFECS